MAEKRVRRSKKDVVLGDIAKIEQKISDYEAKIAKLNEDKENLEATLKEIASAEDKAKQEAEQKEMMALLKKKGMSLDDLKAMLEQ